MSKNRSLKKQYFEESHNFKEAQDLREKSNLGKLDVKKRYCLRCDQEFMSFGINNRMCEMCVYLITKKYSNVE